MTLISLKVKLGKYIFICFIKLWYVSTFNLISPNSLWEFYSCNPEIYILSILRSRKSDQVQRLQLHYVYLHIYASFLFSSHNSARRILCHWLSPKFSAQFQVDPFTLFVYQVIIGLCLFRMICTKLWNSEFPTWDPLPGMTIWLYLKIGLWGHT